MDAEKALEIIRLLADGIDPTTGEVFSEDGPYNKPEVIRALFRAISALEGTRQKQRGSVRYPANQGKPWPKEDDTRLVAGFDSGMSVSQLADEFQRTTGSVESRLFKLGRNPDRGHSSGEKRPPRETDDSFAGEIFRRRPRWKV